LGAHACTDVTGFGLLRHLLGMMKASGTTVQIQSQHMSHFLNIPAIFLLVGRFREARKTICPTPRRITEYYARIPLSLRHLLNDAQTSGGLLISLNEAAAEEFKQKMQAAGRTAWLIGKVTEKSERFIQVI
jgi:selenophosphate synthase